MIVLMILVRIEIAPSASGGTSPDVADRKPVRDCKMMDGILSISLFLDATAELRL
jgi:hypothetical protein